MISVPVFLLLELVGAALLALWFVARFPAVGPRSLRTSMLVSGLALLALQGAPYAIPVLMLLPHGAYAALLGFVLPLFFAAFVAVAWLMRALASALGGSGGGGLPVSNSGR